MPIRMTGMTSGLDTDAVVKELVSAYSKKTEKYEKAQTKLGWKQDAWKSLNKKVKSFFNKAGTLRFSSGYTTKKTTVSDSTKASVTAGSGAVNGSQKLHVLATAQSGYLTGGKLTTGSGATEKMATASTKLSELGVTDEASFDVTLKDGSTKTITLNADSTIDNAINALKDAGVSASFDANNGRIFVSSNKTGAKNDFDLVAGSSNESRQLLGALGLDSASNAKKIDGNDATIVLNGVEYTSDSNSFSINGLSITANAVTDAHAFKADGSVDMDALSDANAVTINTSADVQGLYDKVKSFITDYNSIVNEMTKLYNAPSAKGYEPLTDDEKDAMTDTEIEKWETKIKDSVLRRDDTLSGLISSMSSAMSKSFKIDGKDYSLGSFGIRTLGYYNSAENEQNSYHIDGDSDDENTSGNADRLMAALSENSDTVVEFMKQLSTSVYKTLDGRMKSMVGVKSRDTIYNDVTLDNQYKNYTKTIKEWEAKVTEKEDYYYKKFSKMESTLSKIQSQTSSLTGMFG